MAARREAESKSNNQNVELILPECKQGDHGQKRHSRGTASNPAPLPVDPASWPRWPSILESGASPAWSDVLDAAPSAAGTAFDRSCWSCPPKLRALRGSWWRPGWRHPRRCSSRRRLKLQPQPDFIKFNNYYQIRQRRCNNQNQFKTYGVWFIWL